MYIEHCLDWKIKSVAPPPKRTCLRTPTFVIEILEEREEKKVKHLARF